jgi:hypothetical protein
MQRTVSNDHTRTATELRHASQHADRWMIHKCKEAVPVDAGDPQDAEESAKGHHQQPPPLCRARVSRVQALQHAVSSCALASWELCAATTESHHAL